MLRSSWSSKWREVDAFEDRNDKISYGFNDEYLMMNERKRREESRMILVLIFLHVTNYMNEVALNYDGED